LGILLLGLKVVYFDLTKKHLMFIDSSTWIPNKSPEPTAGRNTVLRLSGWLRHDLVRLWLSFFR
jgi:hypothetical protein